MTTFRLLAVPGRRVRDPRTLKVLPYEGDGEVKPRDSYWLRRLRDGDVVEAAETAAVDFPEEN